MSDGGEEEDTAAEAPADDEVASEDDAVIGTPSKASAIEGMAAEASAPAEASTPSTADGMSIGKDRASARQAQATGHTPPPRTGSRGAQATPSKDIRTLCLRT